VDLRDGQAVVLFELRGALKKNYHPFPNNLLVVAFMSFVGET
jgi:hypothetical protein